MAGSLRLCSRGIDRTGALKAIQGAATLRPPPARPAHSPERAHTPISKEISSPLRNAMLPPVDEIVANFELLDDWEERYRYLIELGRMLPTLPPEAHSDANKVQGCASQVWLDRRIEPAAPEPILHWRGDSDAHIVRGGKYPPAKPGALGDVPLEAADGSLTRPESGLAP